MSGIINMVKNVVIKVTGPNWEPTNCGFANHIVKLPRITDVHAIDFLQYQLRKRLSAVNK